MLSVATKDFKLLTSVHGETAQQSQSIQVSCINHRTSRRTAGFCAKLRTKTGAVHSIPCNRAITSDCCWFISKSE